jgi:FixJ family two-component response regulator
MRIRDRERKPDNSLEGAVCVIDGDQGIRNSLYMLLGTYGIRAATFPTAEEFLNRLDVERPSFLITELALPGIGGFELKEALDRRGIHMPVIGLTGEAGKQKRREASRLGFLELVEKPFVYLSVVQRVQQTLGTPC